VQPVIVHIDMDCFFVAVERTRDPSLVGKPVVVGGSSLGNRGVVTSASYEARRYGIHSAMPIVVARKLCPQAAFVPGTPGIYGKVSREIGKIFKSWAPAVEMASIDEAYLDLTGCERCYGPAIGTVDRILADVRATFGLDLSAGLAANRLVAKVASKCAKPSGLLQVLPGREEQFMAGLRLGDVPGVGEVLEGRLRAMGLTSVGDLQRLDKPLLERTFGSSGRWLYEMARGRGSLEVETERAPVKSVGNSVTFSQDTVDRSFLDAVLYRLSEKVGARVRDKGMVGRTVTLRLRYSDFKTLTRSDSSSPGTNSDQLIFERARALMIPLLERRVRVRLLGVTLSKLRQSDGQYGLFTVEKQKREARLYGTVDAIRGKYGFDLVRKGPALPMKSLRKPPEEKKAG
jgi:DNA polymerase IV